MLTFKNIRIIDNSKEILADVLINNGKIAAIGNNLPEQGSVIDFKNKQVVLLPAFTDLHAHFRDPGFTYKETLETGCQAALHGGYTAVNLMPNTNPVCNSLQQVREIEKRAKNLNLIYVNQTLSMTHNLEGNDYQHLLSLSQAEIPFVSNDGKGVDDDKVMLEIFKICKDKHITIMQHAEDKHFSKTDMRIAENNMTFRDIGLFEKIGGHHHFCHVSTIEAIEAIADAQQRGLNITCEVTPHHIAATDDEMNHYRVNPPFRKQHDIDALIKAIQNGNVAAIATDHAPHSEEDKKNGSPGMIGLELAFPICYSKLVRTGHISLQKLIALMSTNPSEMMKLNKGKIEVGQDADLVIADLNTPFTFQPEDILSKSKNSPFFGKVLYGKILHTLCSGKIYNW